MKAAWKNKVIAESNKTVIIEGNHYFPPDAVKKEYLQESEHHTICPWKGRASYYNIAIHSDTNSNAAWYYPEPKDAAKEIKGYIAFWKGVEVKD